MQSYFAHSGYGYSKRLCEDVTAWFLNRFFPNHKIQLEIVHRGLRREQVYGYCDCIDDSYRPRQFVIELNTYMTEEVYIKTLLHELTHLKQWIEGRLRFRYGKMCYGTEPVENYDYWYQPHEIEAREEEETLYMTYILEKKPTIFTQESIDYFPNRLMN